MPPTVLLARHGRSLWNEEGRIAGQADPPLTPAGRRQAERLATVLGPGPLDAVYASSLTRALETATPVARERRLEVSVRPELCEIHFGDLQGRYRDDRDPAARDALAAWRANPQGPPAPGGESLEDLAARVTPLVRSILEAHESGRVLIVAHRYTNRAILGTLLGVEAAQWPRLRIKTRRLLEISAGTPPRLTAISLRADQLGRRRDDPPLWD